MHSRLDTPQNVGLYYASKRNQAAQAALVDDMAAPAWGTFTFSANPSNGHTITINGTVITFGSTFALGANLAATLTAAVNYILANPISGGTVTVSGNGLLVQSTTPGDNSITLAASNATVSGATLKRRKIHARVPL